MSPLQTLLETYRQAAATNREAGTYFEQLTTCYFQHEPAYRELYRAVQPYADWAKHQGITKTDTGIDLVAETHTGEFHAIQCKLFAPDHRVQNPTSTASSPHLARNRSHAGTSSQQPTTGPNMPKTHCATSTHR